MERHTENARTRVRSTVVAVFFVLALGTALYFDDVAGKVISQSRRPAPPRPAKYSAFPHDTKAHRLDCATCHKFPSANWEKVRSREAAIPDITEYPKHDSCVGCHRQQFFRGSRPVICSICHTNPGPRNPERHPFPNPRETFDMSAKGKTAESDFEIGFSHEKHVDIVSFLRPTSGTFRNASYREPRAEESCAVCHTTLKPQGNLDDEYVTKPPANIGDGLWLKKGTFKSVPIGHTTCFTCHSQDSGIEPTPVNCAACHKLKQAAPRSDHDPKLAAQMGLSDRVLLDAWRRRDSSGTFRHEFTSHAELSCDSCHSVAKMNTLDPQTKIVPISSCAMCHATATVDDGGVINFEVQSRKTNATFKCTKCHVMLGTLPVPQSHLKAIIEAGGKP